MSFTANPNLLLFVCLPHKLMSTVWLWKSLPLMSFDSYEECWEVKSFSCSSKLHTARSTSHARTPICKELQLSLRIESIIKIQWIKTCANVLIGTYCTGFTKTTLIWEQAALTPPSKSTAVSMSLKYHVRLIVALRDK